MNNLLPIHKYLLGACALGVLLVCIVHYLWLKPIGEQLESLKEEVEDSKKALIHFAVPEDVQMLNTLMGQAKGTLKERKTQSRELLDKYDAVYLPVIQKNGWKNTEAFIAHKPQPSRDMYMREFERVIQLSPMGNLNLPGGKLGLEISSDSPKRHQLLLQLWGIETILTKAKLRQLSLATDAQGVADSQNRSGRGNRKGDSSSNNLELPALSVLNPTELSSVGSKKSDILKLTFVIGVTGNLNDLAGFISDLRQPECYFGFDGFELIHLPPANDAPAEKPGVLRLNLKLVSFFPMDDSGKDE
ncbi:MAG: hypothetical protein J6X55_01710 [Victivallales bacterium]|nr:hypothetical protein [Victivallales bacterium]